MRRDLQAPKSPPNLFTPLLCSLKKLDITLRKYNADLCVQYAAIYMHYATVIMPAPPGIVVAPRKSKIAAIRGRNAALGIILSPSVLMLPPYEIISPPSGYYAALRMCCAAPSRQREVLQMYHVSLRMKDTAHQRKLPELKIRHRAVPPSEGIALPLKVCYRQLVNMYQLMHYATHRVFCRPPKALCHPPSVSSGPRGDDTAIEGIIRHCSGL